MTKQDRIWALVAEAARLTDELIAAGEKPTVVYKVGPADTGPADVRGVVCIYMGESARLILAADAQARRSATIH